jgi:antitoxin YefM
MINMTAISATKARENLYQLIADVNASNSAITITNNRGKNAVILSEDDWNAVQETLYLMSVPGLTESLMEGGKDSIEDCLSEDEVEW